MDHKSNPVERTTRQEKEETLNPLGRRSQKISCLRLGTGSRIKVGVGNEVESGIRNVPGSEWRLDQQRNQYRIIDETVCPCRRNRQRKASRT
ncbi:hypothetical protein EVAR_99234_1 [Eumeta japonica]|uniref:Uncharacterized protein n=1 Tax=Eumeta variegata TaxID=151549 RepID=A0A4C2ADD4_EUMVA|nr:hypothetical protein EVAR_99234_1 [Eumeta japonica]